MTEGTPGGQFTTTSSVGAEACTGTNTIIYHNATRMGLPAWHMTWIAPALGTPGDLLSEVWLTVIGTIRGELSKPVNNRLKMYTYPLRRREPTSAAPTTMAPTMAPT